MTPKGEVTHLIRAQRDSETAAPGGAARTLLSHGAGPGVRPGRLPVLQAFWTSWTRRRWSGDPDQAAQLPSLKRYAELFDYENVKVTFSDEDAAKLPALATRARCSRKVGARGLPPLILEELMLDLMYYVPGNKKVAELAITAEMVKKHSLTPADLLLGERPASAPRYRGNGAAALSKSTIREIPEHRARRFTTASCVAERHLLVSDLGVPRKGRMRPRALAVQSHQDAGLPALHPEPMPARLMGRLWRTNQRAF